MESNKIKTIVYLSSTISKLKKVNKNNEFKGELEFLIKIREGVKNTLTTGQGKLIAAIVD